MVVLNLVKVQTWSREPLTIPLFVVMIPRDVKFACHRRCHNDCTSVPCMIPVPLSTALIRTLTNPTRLSTDRLAKLNHTGVGIMMITDSRNDSIIELNECPPTLIELEKFAPSYDLSELSVDETKQSQCDRVGRPNDKPPAGLIMNRHLNTSDASKVSLEEPSPLVLDSYTYQAFHDVSESPTIQPSIFNGVLRSRINTADSGRSQNSFRSLLGDRKRRSVHPCKPASEIIIGAIVGESDLIIAPEGYAKATFSTKRNRSIVKQGMRKLSNIVRDLVRCMRLFPKPFQNCTGKTEDVVLIRAEGRLM